MKRLPTLLSATLACALAFPVTAQDGALQAEIARRDLLAQKTFLLVEHHVANARALEERLDLAGAEAQLVKARDLDPTNKVVLDYLAQVQALLGRPEAEARALAVSAAERYAAQQQQMKVVALADLASAERALTAGDAALAQDLARGVVNRIDWTSGTIDWGDIGGRARALLARAEGSAGANAEALRRAKEAEAWKKLQEEESLADAQADARQTRMLEAGYDRFMANDFQGGAKLAAAVLEEDPSDPWALELAAACRDGERDSANERFLTRRREEMRRWRESMEAVRIPYRDILTPPDRKHWDEITRKRAGIGAGGLAVVDPEVQALSEQLAATRMDVEFQEMTIVQVANNISFSTDIPVSIDPEVSTELDDAAEYVTLTGLRDLPVESVLNILVEQVGQDLAWTIRNGRVYVTKTEKAAGSPVVRVHSIQDLTFPITDFKGVSIRDIPLPGEAGDDNETTIFNSELDRVRLIEPDEVLNLVRENISRESWDASESYSIDFVDNQNLLVIHTPEVQAQVADFLDDLRTFSTSMVTIEARFFALTDAFIEEIGTDLRGLGPDVPDGGLGSTNILDDVDPDNTQGLDNNGDGTGNPNAGVFFEDGGDQSFAASNELFFNNPLGKLMSTVGGGAFQFTILDDTQVNVVMQAVQKSRNAFEISAPIVSVYNTQRAFVTVVNQVSYVQGYDVDVATAAFIADPNIGVVQEGIVLDVRPTISFDRRYVTLDVQTTVSNLERPFETFSTFLGGNTTQVSFALPKLDVQDAQTTVVVPDGGTVILGGFKHVLYRNRTAEAPWLADIPILGFFFREKGLADEMTDLIVAIKATVSDYSALKQTPVAKR